MATPQDAELILRLYELRTEATMREARNFMLSFQPKTFDELLALQRGIGTKENAYWRQVNSYWEMGAAFVLTGALDAELFLEANGENFFYYARFTPFFEQIAATLGQPYMPRLTKLIEQHPSYQARYTLMLARMEALKKQAAG